MDNFLDNLRNALGLTIPNAGESSTPIPKAPAFKTADPIYVGISKLGIPVKTKQKLWERYQADAAAFPEDEYIEWRRDLGRDKNFRETYVNGLLEREERGESLPHPYQERREEISPIDELLKNLRFSSRGVGERKTIR